MNYGSEDNTISLIEKIGNTSITTEMMKDNKIIIDNFIVECDTIDTMKLGSYTVVFTTNATEDRYFKKVVYVKDIEPPKIKIKEDILELNYEEYEQYNFSNFITVTDNYDKQPEVKITIDDITDIGKYMVKIDANDSKGNTAKKEFHLLIKESESFGEEMQENEILSQDEHNQQKTEESQQQEINSNTDSNKSVIGNKKNKDFLFSNGYTMDNVSEVCQSELFSSGYSGRCIPLKDANGIYIGMRLEYH